VPEPSASSQETFRDRYPLTDEQRSTIFHDIAGVKECLQEIAALMRACFGDTSQLFVRAEECSAAVQRFEWELERIRDDNPTVAHPFEPSKD